MGKVLLAIACNDYPGDAAWVESFTEREIVKIGRDPKQWQCCMWQKWQAAQAERDGRRIWKLDRGLGQKTRSETALRKRQHEWQIDNTNDKAILNKQIHQSIHCWSADLRFDSLRLHLFNWSPLSLSLICLLVYQDELILDCFPVFHHCCHGPISSVGQLTFLVAPLLKCYSWIGSIHFFTIFTFKLLEVLNWFLS